MKVSEINEFIKGLDNNPSIIGIKFDDGFLVWPRIRYRVFQLLLENSFHQEFIEPVTESKKSEKSIPKILFKKLSLHYKLFSKKGNWKDKNYDGLCFNGSKIVRPEFDNKIIGKSNLIINKIPNIKILNIYNFDNSNHNETFYGNHAFIDNIIYQARIKAFFNKGFSQSEVDATSKLIECIKIEFSKNNLDNTVLETVNKELLKYLHIHSHLRKIITRIFKKLQPKFIVAEDGNYGGGLSSLILFCANKLGIKTIELQHGVFDVAFDYGSLLLSDKQFKNQKTDLLFTFGKYWSDWVNYPGKCYELGSIYLEESLSSIEEKEEHNSVLFISQGDHTKKLIEVASELSKSLDKDFKIIYKLHPAEFKKAEAYTIAFANNKNIEIVGKANVYEYLKKATFVVGSFSTVLFEGLFLNKAPYIYRDIFSEYYIPENIGFRFSTATELKSLMDNQKHVSQDLSIYWVKDWKKNLEEIGLKEKLW